MLFIFKARQHKKCGIFYYTPLMNSFNKNHGCYLPMQVMLLEDLFFLRLYKSSKSIPELLVCVLPQRTMVSNMLDRESEGQGFKCH